MSTRKTNLRTIQRQASIMSDTGRRTITTSDSIDSIVAELLNDEIMSYDPVVGRPQVALQQAEESSCENCKSYYPLLKSFIMHLESSHKAPPRQNTQMQRYKCELCGLEFESSLALGMHSLLHVYGKTIVREFHANPNGLANPVQAISANEGTPQNNVLQSNAGQITSVQVTSEHIDPPTSTQVVDLQFTENVVQDSGIDYNQLAVSSNEMDLKQKEATEVIEHTAVPEIRRRGRPRKSTALNFGAKPNVPKHGRPLKEAIANEEIQLVNLTTLVPLKTVAQGIPGSTKTIQDISVLLPALQGRICDISQTSSEATLADDLIRPRVCDTEQPNPVPASNTLTDPGSVMSTPVVVQQPTSSVDLASSLGTTSQTSVNQATTVSQEPVSSPNVNESKIDVTERVNERKKRNADNQCIICLEKFPTKESLRSHRFTHGDREKWPCSDCSREFSSHWKFHDHCVKVHNNKKPFKCDVCGKCLSSFTILATHKGLHSGARPYECELCGKGYLVAAGLKDHMIVHKNEREHRCGHCGAGFNAKGDLKKHMVTHMEEKPHMCVVCNTGFNRSASLRRHMRSHTGEKPFKCDLCEKAFSRKEKMIEHRRTHTGERPLVCSTCGKSFKDSSNYSNHKKIHSIDYVPRKRKRTGGPKPETINSVIIHSTQPVTQTVVTDSTALPGLVIQKQAPMTVSAKENALKDLATISTTIEDLQSAGQEWLRQILGANFDQNEFRNLINAQAAVSVPSSIFNLSADDVKSLQMIINGVQARNANLSVDNSTQVPGTSN